MGACALRRHGGRDCADWVAERLPQLLAAKLLGVSASAAVKEAIKDAFVACDLELLELCRARGWCDGCCVIGVFFDRQCTPARAYCANLGDSRAFAACSTGGGTTRAVPLSKDHTALDAKERKRIVAAGGYVEAGRLCGSIEVSRSLGDVRLKAHGMSAVPDVTSFSIGPEQRFVVLGCDGLWNKLSGQQLVDMLEQRIPRMDSRRHELALLFSKPSELSGLTKDAMSSLTKERDSTNEEAILRSLVHEAVHEHKATDNVSVLLVRL